MAAAKEPVVPVEESVVEVVVYAASAVTEDLLQAKINVEASDCVLKSQICTLLDQAIQASLVK